MKAGERNSLIRIYAAHETRGTLQSVVTTWVPVRDEWGGFLPEFLTLRNYGAGEVSNGTRELHLDAYSGVESRFGLEVLDGPEKGTTWRAVSVDRSDPALTRVRIEPHSGGFA